MTELTRPVDFGGRVLVAGCGSIGRRHLRNLARVGAGPLVAYDPDGSRAQQAALEVGALLVQNLDDIPTLAAAFVCSPTSRHLSVARVALDRGAHLFIEKPISNTLDGVDALLGEARRRSRCVMVGFNLRFHPCLRRLKQLLDDGTIGRILGARVQFGQYLPDWHPWENYRQGYSANKVLGGGIVLDAVHEFDYARWLLGEVSAVSGMMRSSGTLEIDTEDLAAFVLRHDDGIISEIHLDYLQRVYTRTCHLIGAEGTISWDWNRHAVCCYQSRSATREEFPEPTGYDENDTYLDELRAFAAAVAGDAAPPVDGAAGARVLAIALAAKEATRTGRTVTI